MDIFISTIPHDTQRYDTIGDWQFTKDSLDKTQLTIKVSDLSNKDSEFLVGIHELIEAYLCQKAGISQEQVDEFDFNNKDDEPGENWDAPYYKQHLIAECIEKQLCIFLGMDWRDHEKRIEEL